MMPGVFGAAAPVRRALVAGALATLLGGFLPATAAEPEDAAWLCAPALHGMTGLITTPTAYTLPSGALRVGFGWYDKEWAYFGREGSTELPAGTDNYHYFLTFGFVSRVEVSIRASYFPDDCFTQECVQKGTVDRGGNARLQVFREGKTVPAVAVGIDDVRGTRKFHALYAVGSKTFSAKSDFLKLRVSAGYGSDAIDARTYVLDGFFGGAEVSLGRYGSLALDYDTEKWNTGLRFYAFRHLTAYFALLHMEAPAGGVSWTHQF